MPADDEVIIEVEGHTDEMWKATAGGDVVLNSTVVKHRHNMICLGTGAVTAPKRQWPFGLPRVYICVEGEVRPHHTSLSCVLNAILNLAPQKRIVNADRFAAGGHDHNSSAGKGFSWAGHPIQLQERTEDRHRGRGEHHTHGYSEQQDVEHAGR